MSKSRNKKFREKYKYVPLTPLMPRKYNREERERLKKYEQELLQEIENAKEENLKKFNIGKEPGE